MLEFQAPMDKDSYATYLKQVFLNKNVLYQLAFDFYDTNNDDRISELDLFKIMQTFSNDYSV